jgi:hypothetical protein
LEFVINAEEIRQYNIAIAMDAMERDFLLNRLNNLSIFDQE